MRSIGHHSLLKSFALATILSAVFQISACKKDDPEPPKVPKEDLPVADFTLAAEGRTVQLTFSGSNAENYAWSFGDGTSATEANPIHKYPDFGAYTISLIVTNAAGSDTLSDNITIDVAELKRPPELNLTGVDGVFTASNHQRRFVANGVAALVKNGSADVWCAGSSGYSNVGTVKFKQESYLAELERDTDNKYTWSEPVSEQVGFKKSAGPAWSITGGGPHGAVSGLANVYPFPGVKNITSAKEIPIGESYTMAHEGGFSGADTVSFSIHGVSGTIEKWVDPAVTQVVFSSAELATIGAGDCVLMIAAYHTYSQLLGSREYKVVNQMITEAPAEIQ